MGKRRSKNNDFSRKGAATRAVGVPAVTLSKGYASDRQEKSSGKSGIVLEVLNPRGVLHSVPVVGLAARGFRIWLERMEIGQSFFL
jgi:hypothetical protein